MFSGFAVLVVCFVIGLLTGLIGEIFGGIAAFQEETLLGVVYLLVPLAEIIICLMLWEKHRYARKGLSLMILSFVICTTVIVIFLAGIFMVRPG